MNTAVIGTGALYVDSVQVISSFVGFMFGYRQRKENYLLIVCFYTDNA